MFTKIISIVLLISITFSMVLCDLVTVAAQEKKSHPKVAIFPFADTNPAAKEAGYGEAIAGMLTTELINGQVFQIIERKEIERIMAEIGLSQTGAIDMNTAKEIGKVYGVDMLVFGNVAKFGNLVETDSRLIDTESGEAILAESASCKSEMEIRTMVVNLARKMEQRFSGKGTAQVIFNSEPTGATVFVNGAMAGVTPLTRAMEYGNYDVKMTRENFSPWQQNVIVVEGENRVQAKLTALQVPTPLPPQPPEAPAPVPEKKGSKAWLFLLGGAVIAGGTAAVLLASKGKEEESNKARVEIIVTIP